MWLVLVILFDYPCFWLWFNWNLDEIGLPTGKILIYIIVGYITNYWCIKVLLNKKIIV